MIIDSSSVNMNSQRKFVSSKSSFNGFSAMGTLSSTHMGMFVQTAITTAENAVNKDGHNSQNKQEKNNSKEDLMARFNESRSIRASGLENSRSLRSIHTIRRQSIGYLLQQMFQGRGRTFSDPLAALLGNNTNHMFSGFRIQTGYSYAEAEQTSFSTEGKVVTASGREITFNVEMSMSRTFYEEASTIIDFDTIVMTDPLVINLDTEAVSVSDQKFYFDLDADGHAEQISRLNAGSGFLALDKNGDGVINDGSELFGTKSGNGFADLKQYDQDGNGWIDEADEIFSKLLIWQKDENGKDVLRGLGQAGVGAIYLGNVSTEFSLNSQTDNKTNGAVRQTGMFLYENGEAGTLQQIDLAQ